MLIKRECPTYKLDYYATIKTWLPVRKQPIIALDFEFEMNSSFTTFEPGLLDKAKENMLRKN